MHWNNARAWREMAGWGDAGDEGGCGDGMGLEGMGGDGDVGWGG